MDTMQTVSQDKDGLKSERVEEALTIEPLHIQLQTSRVKEAQPGSGEAEVKTTTVWSFKFNQPQPVTIELLEPQVVIYLNGPSVQAAPAAA